MQRLCDMRYLGSLIAFEHETHESPHRSRRLQRQRRRVRRPSRLTQPISVSLYPPYNRALPRFRTRAFYVRTHQRRSIGTDRPGRSRRVRLLVFCPVQPIQPRPSLGS